MTMPARGPRPLAKIQSYIRGSMVKEGYSFGVPLLVLGGAGFLLHWYLLAGVLVFLAAFVFYFFRNPERIIPAEPGSVVSPADGRVVVVTDEENAGRPGKRISVFLAVWNVHVNRSPAAGTITKLNYCPGKFSAAMRECASTDNEQNVITLETDAGELTFKQIAGLIARRVVCWKKSGDRVARGERIGLVRFGSRADLWLPRDSELLVKVGDHVAGGSSVVAYWRPRAKTSYPRGAQTQASSDENLSPAEKR